MPRATVRQSLLDDPHVWGAFIAAKFARETGLPVENYWEPVIARTLAQHVIDGKRSRDQVEPVKLWHLSTRP